MSSLPLRASLLIAALVMLPTTLPAVAAAPDAPSAPPTLAEALQRVIDEGMTDLRALQLQAKSAVSDEEARATGAAVIAAKADLERRLLEVQLDYALRDGNAELVAELEGILHRLDRPAVGVPQDRPAPATAPAAR